jgi:phage tail-like protein
MTATKPLPPIPQPPHDPTFWLLNATVGWREAVPDKVQVLPGSGALALAPAPGSGRALTEPSGSFGGLTLPGNVALGPGGEIFLLDAKTLTLRLFDACDCRFVTVPCFAGPGRDPRGGEGCQDLPPSGSRRHPSTTAVGPSGGEGCLDGVSRSDPPPARQLKDPHGIGICAGNLFVCDTGHHRLSVFALRGYVLRDHWSPPVNPNLKTWEPYAVAFDGKGRVFVTDGANGCVHRFRPSGIWETCLPGFGKATWIAIDCMDRVYVRVEGETGVRIVDTDGKPIVDTDDKPVVDKDGKPVVDKDGKPISAGAQPEALAALFPGLPFPVDKQGNLHLGALCIDAKSGQTGVFDLNGDPTTAAAIGGPLYETLGDYYSEALDSDLYRCQWHRIVLRGQVPVGSRIEVKTYTAEALQPTDTILNLPPDAWATRQTVLATKDGVWDGLIRSGGGRYLWLNLTLRGNGMVTPTIESLRIEYPRISLRRYLPGVFGADPGAADFADRFLSIFDTGFRSIENEIDNLARYFDPMSAPAGRSPGDRSDFLSWLASWIGVSLDRHWPEAKQRRLLKEAARLHPIRGTRIGLWRQLLLLMDMEPEPNCCPDDRPRTRCSPTPDNCAPVEICPCAWEPPPLILEHYQLRRWLFFGASRLGDQAELWGKKIVNRSQLNTNAQVGQTQLIDTPDPFRDPFHVYAHKFTVFVPACYGKSDRLRKSLENLLRTERPAHTLALVEYVEPRLRIGIQSTIGLNTVVGRYPEGVTLNESALGRGSVLSEPPQKQGPPTLEIGRWSRVGTTTKLD